MHLVRKAVELLFCCLLMAATTGCIEDPGQFPGETDAGWDGNRRPDPDLGEMDFTGLYRLESSLPERGPIDGAIENAIAKRYGSPGRFLEHLFVREAGNSLWADFWREFFPRIFDEFDALEFYDVPVQIADLFDDIRFSSNLTVDSFGRHATHEVTRVSFRLAGRTHSRYIYDRDFPDYDGFITDRVPVFYAGEQLRIEAHELQVPLAAVIALEMQEDEENFFGPGGPVVQMMQSAIDCEDFAQRADDYYGGSGVYVSAWFATCQVAIREYASEIQDMLIEDGSSMLELRGSAVVVDSNSDFNPDRLTNGIWVGTLDQNDESVSLAGMTFTGSH